MMTYPFQLGEADSGIGVHGEPLVHGVMFSLVT